MRPTTWPRCPDLCWPQPASSARHHPCLPPPLPAFFTTCRYYSHHACGGRMTCPTACTHCLYLPDPCLPCPALALDWTLACYSPHTCLSTTLCRLYLPLPHCGCGCDCGCGLPGPTVASVDLPACLPPACYSITCLPACHTTTYHIPPPPPPHITMQPTSYHHHHHHLPFTHTVWLLRRCGLVILYHLLLLLYRHTPDLYTTIWDMTRLTYSIVIWDWTWDTFCV